VILFTAAAPPFMKNGYVLGCERTRQAMLIDPGDEVDQLLAFAKAERLEIVGIPLTHAHVDHVSGVAQAKRQLSVPIYLHRDDLFLYEQATAIGLKYGLQVETPPPVDVFYDLSPIRFGDYEVRVHHTPGHCPGGVAAAATGRDPGRHVGQRVGGVRTVCDRAESPRCRSSGVGQPGQSGRD